MGVSHDRGYHPLPVKRVSVEIPDARSYTLDVPPALATAFRYEAGQFVTFRVPIGDRTFYRSYSMSSAPAVDDELTVVVKRVPDGAVSNWINDSLHEGDSIDSSVPAGVFRLGPQDRNLVAFAAGSGITPIYSILKTALATTSRNAQLLYANRDVDSVIFDNGLDELAATYPGRLLTTHHLDSDRGFVTAADIEPFIDAALTADVFICGPAPFMDLVESTLLTRGVPQQRIHIERFTVTPADDAEQAAAYAAPTADTGDRAQVTIEVDGRTATTTHHPGATILQTARQMGMTPPFSCEAGNCATCMAKLVEGEVKMHVNDALFDDEVADGWILTCQSVPTTPTVHVIYGYED
ncbi:MAG TPA: ferredoxin--NADP reductase [Mycobacteriales bacterium]|nr:ferredoxin--NADP reductase [Mycobacteriales bacterium]HWA66245.1 ferredoxin--NADP reductase [Mycobacteriales bacterium]